MTDEEVVLEAVKIALDDVGIESEIRHNGMLAPGGTTTKDLVSGLFIRLGPHERRPGQTDYEQILEAYIHDGVFHLTRTFLFLAPQWELCNPAFLDQLISVIRKESE